MKSGLKWHSYPIFILFFALGLYLVFSGLFGDEIGASIFGVIWLFGTYAFFNKVRQAKKSLTNPDNLKSCPSCQKKIAKYRSTCPHCSKALETQFKVPDNEEELQYQLNRLRLILKIVFPMAMIGFLSFVANSYFELGQGLLVWIGLIGAVAAFTALVLQFKWKCPVCDTRISRVTEGVVRVMVGLDLGAKECSKCGFDFR